MRAQPRSELTRAGSDDFYYVTLGPLTGPPTRFLLDSNVISIAESLMSRDFRPQHLDDRRLLRLVERRAAHPQTRIEDSFALLEGSSIHSPEGINPASLCKRSLAVNLIDGASEDVTVLLQQRGLLEMELPEDIDTVIGRRLDAACGLMDSLFAPGYLAALALEERLGQSGPVDRIDIDTAEWLLSRLDSTLNFVPRMVWHTVLAATLGNQTLQQNAMGVFKTGAREHGIYEPARNAMSAARDMAQLQLLSVWVAMDEEPVLVTNDKKLGALADAFDLSTPQGQLPRRAVAPRQNGAASRLSGRYAITRGIKTVTALLEPPRRQFVADAVREGERRLGLATPIPEIIANGVQVPRLQLHCQLHHVEDVIILSGTVASEEREARFVSLFGRNQIEQAHLDAAILITNVLVRLRCDDRGLTHRQILATSVEADLDRGSDLALMRTVSFAEKFCRPAISNLGAAFTYQAALTLEQFPPRLVGSIYLIGRLASALAASLDMSEADVMATVMAHARRQFPNGECTGG